jgi:hypothetical protein
VGSQSHTVSRTTDRGDAGSGKKMTTKAFLLGTLAGWIIIWNTSLIVDRYQLREQLNSCKRALGHYEYFEKQKPNRSDLTDEEILNARGDKEATPHQQAIPTQGQNQGSADTP